MSDTLFDFSKYSDNFKDNWESFVNSNQSFPSQIYQLYSKGLVLPNGLIQYPLIITYMFLPSALSKLIPLLIAYGESGSGKSLTGYFASKLHNTQILSSSDTFASMRNTLNNIKYHEDGTEKNCLMVWEDIDPDVLISKPDIYRMLKYGVDKSCDTISIATQNGTNLSFRVFTPKIISTISPIFNNSEMIEIQRRCMVLNTKKLVDTDLILNLIDLKEIDYKGINSKFNSFWQNEQKCIEFIQYKKLLHKIKNHGLPVDKYMMSIDFLATLLCLEIECFECKFTNTKISINNINEAIIYINKYWEYHQNLCETSNTIFLNLLKNFINERTTFLLSKGINESEIYLSPSKLEQLINQWDNQGLIVVSNNKKRLQLINLMFQLGYQLTKKGYKKI